MATVTIPAVIAHMPETGSFSKFLSRIGEALDSFERYDQPDPMTRSTEWTEALTGPLPETGIGADAAISELVDLVVPNGQRIADPRFSGFITAAPSTVPLAAATAAMIASPQRQTLSAFHLIEKQSLEWLAQLCGLGPHMKGVYASGGSVANLLAIGAARQWALANAGVDAGADGLGNLKTAIYASAEAHHTIQRAAGVLGLGRRSVRPIPVDDQMRIDVDELRTALVAGRDEGVLPIAVVATAGTTNTGAIDPLRACGDLAREFGAWFHVDGAYGLPGLLDQRVAPLYDGLDLADSAIVDPHKWLGAPVGVAATFVRDRAQLLGAFTQEPADYLEGSFTGDVECSFDSLGVPYADMTVELSSPARGVTVWSLLREQGRSGVAARVRRDNDYARTVHDLASGHPRLESVLEPQLSIATIRYVGASATTPPAALDDLNRSVHRRLIRETRYLPSTTMVRGVFTIRPCFINTRTTPEDVTGLVDEIVRIGDELTAR